MGWKKWITIQRITIARGYVWCQAPILAVLLATQLKLLFPAFFDGVFRFGVLIISSFFFLYLVGWIDKHWEFLHEENSYYTDTNPSLLREIRGESK